MKNYVKFNQGNFVKIGKEKNIKVDTIDGTLFDWVRTFMLSDRAMKKIIDNKLYIWVSYQAIREDNPLCNITSNDAVGRRLSKLIDLGLLKKFLSKEDGNKTFFSITEFAYTYLLEDRELPTQKSEDLPTQKSDNSKLQDSELIAIKKINKKEIASTENLDLAKRTIDYLNSKINKHYGHIDGNLKEIKAQIKKLTKQGDTLKQIEDKFAYVINVKVADWIHDEKMKKHLTPVTLFREANFDRYLNQDMQYSAADMVDKIYEARQRGEV